MRKSLVLVLTAVGGGAAYATGVTEVATGPGMGDPSTWRWQVTSILSRQSDATGERLEPAGMIETGAFSQRYERYTPLGRPEPRGDAR
jgi:hypothetical protein